MKTLIRPGILVWKPSAEPLANTPILIDDGVVAAIGDDAEHAVDGSTATIDCPEQTLAPGLIDCHVHLVWSGRGDDLQGRNPLYAAIGMPPAAMAAQVITNMQAALASGVTTVRDCGGIAEVILPIAQAVRSGEVVGPRILSSGAPITTTGGHCWFLENEAEGVDLVRQAVRRMHKAGADFIKVMATGGATLGSNPRAAQFSQWELDAIAADAHRLALPVSGHAHGTEGIERVVAAGFDTIEHCSWQRLEDGVDDYRPSVVERILEQRIFVCKTIAGFQRWPLEELEAAGQAHDAWQSYATFRDMVAAGVPIVAGTDAGITDTNFVHLNRTMETMVGLGGMTPASVLASATETAAEALRLEAEVGSLEVGKRADCILLHGNPLEDVRALREPEMVMRDGVIVARGGGVRVAGAAVDPASMAVR